MPPPAEGFASRLLLGPTLRTQPDRRLVTLVRDGYEVAFEEIVRRYGRPLGRYAASIVGGRSEDVTQDAFAKALLALRRDDAEVELRPWLFRIVRNTALNDLRDRPPSPEILAEALVGGRNPAEELERREELTDLMRRLDALPEPQRAAIVMRELEGLGHKEIAAALGLTGGGARQAIYRARQALRDAAGLLLPLPLLRELIDHGAQAAGAGASVGSTVAVASAGGAGGAVKLGVVTAVLAGSVGAGVAVQEQRAGDGARAPEIRSAQRLAPGLPPSPSTALAALPSSDSRPVEQGRGPEGRGRGRGEVGGRGGEDGAGRDEGRHGDEGRRGQRPVAGKGHRRHGGRAEGDLGGERRQGGKRGGHGATRGGHHLAHSEAGRSGGATGGAGPRGGHDGGGSANSSVGGEGGRGSSGGSGSGGEVGSGRSPPGPEAESMTGSSSSDSGGSADSSEPTDLGIPDGGGELP
jgi:RNA polymerase sigma factor (sigma-70 family)